MMEVVPGKQRSTLQKHPIFQFSSLLQFPITYLTAFRMQLNSNSSLLFSQHKFNSSHKTYCRSVALILSINLRTAIVSLPLGFIIKIMGIIMLRNNDVLQSTITTFIVVVVSL
jgi:hypothetical protein